jgi:hypothetical protein
MIEAKPSQLAHTQHFVDTVYIAGLLGGVIKLTGPFQYVD